ncbi:YfiR family protein [Psychrosphaera sp. 1_MG-2023]|uniref:YfiR family protein n=1 Tax=Psychrosphaera sp. 1_MG-2023 TaxID=3062643 RepID=UPI0026E15ECA|nr:YfiR family protein [Psychrosphaera sp. 1_MG-2023]MDO6718328.1 YfiR family protein [Psychrosphaera sp. 1_MG-2023]
MKVKYLQILLLVSFLLFSLTYSKQATAKTTTPLELKAVLIYKIGAYLRSRNSPTIKDYCFVGEKGKVLADLLIAMVKSRELQNTINVTTESSLEKFGTRQCHILYVADIPKDMEQKLVSLSQSTLTIVGDVSQLKKGGIVSIEVQGRKSTLYTSLSNLKNSDIEIHSRLLSIMTNVD